MPQSSPVLRRGRAGRQPAPPRPRSVVERLPCARWCSRARTSGSPACRGAGEADHPPSTSRPRRPSLPPSAAQAGAPQSPGRAGRGREAPRSGSGVRWVTAWGARGSTGTGLSTRRQTVPPPPPPGQVELPELLKLVPGETYPGQTGRWLQTSSIFKRVWEVPLEEA